MDDKTAGAAQDALSKLDDLPGLFFTFAEQFPGGVIIKDAQHRILYMNPYLLELQGRERSLLRSPSEFMEPQHAVPLMESDQAALDNGLADVVVAVPDKNGEIRHWRTLRFPISASGQEPLLGILALDITENKRMERELEEQNCLYKAVIENFPAGFIALFDKDLRYMLVRGEGLEVVGRTPEEVEGKTIHDIFPAEALAVIEPNYKAALQGETNNYDVEINGNHYNVTSLPVMDCKKNVVAGMVITQFASDRYRVQNMLHRRDQEYKALVENAHDIIARFDRNYRLLYINPAFERITTLPLSWFRNIRLDELHVPSTTLKNFIKAINGVFASGEETSIEIKYTPKTGAKTFQVRLTPEMDTRGEVETVLAVGRDISEYKRLEQQLRRAKEQAESASKAKSEFLATMSHEIRTPMNAMLGYMDLITADSLEPMEREYLQVVKGSAETLLTVINDILDYSKIEAGKVELDAQAFSPKSVIEAVIKEHAALADQKDLRLYMRCDNDLPAALLGDISRLKQILRNLVSNALKFTEEGSVTVAVSLEPSQPSPGKAMLRFSVTDTGVGMSQEQKEKLFESFTQFESGMRRKYKGTGLGLAICKKLIGLLGGNIWVESEKGKGSSFAFTAEFEEAAAHQQPRDPERPKRQPGKPAIPPMKILLAEDNEINRAFMTELLLEHGHTVNVAENGQEVLEKLKAGRFDMVLMDVQMPVMDGMEATRLIREGKAEGVNAGIPIIGLSAYAMREYQEQFLSAGMNAFVSKPVDFATLFRTIDQVHEASREQPPASPETPPSPEPVPEPEKSASPPEHDQPPLIDVEGITDHYASKSELFSRLCTMFFESVRDNMAKLKTEARDEHLANVERLAHSIRGSAASMGAQRLSEAAARLEEAAGNGRREDLAQGLLRLEQVLEPSLAQMDALRRKFTD